MPLYEYKCANCGKKFEVIQKFADEPLTVHAECGSGPVERLISVSALQFKGSGWYVNDYAKNGGPSKESGSKESGSKESGSKDSKEKSGSESGKSEGSTDSKSSDSSGTKTEAAKAAAPAPSASSSEK
jgi:putative FmdB family regulatory protein